VKIENSPNATAPALGDISSVKSSQKAEIVAQNLSTPPPDSVQLSTQLQDIENNLLNTDVFDSARVEEIKQAISEGRFVVNTEKVADRLLESVRDLLRAAHG
jgi:negative regulator of flagellin synthesis FlgM